jgi:hypothetical protein
VRFRDELDEEPAVDALAVVLEGVDEVAGVLELVASRPVRRCGRQVLHREECLEARDRHAVPHLRLVERGVEAPVRGALDHVELETVGIRRQHRFEVDLGLLDFGAVLPQELAHPSKVLVAHEDVDADGGARPLEVEVERLRADHRPFDLGLLELLEEVEDDLG